jgi:hypothetical protein
MGCHATTANQCTACFNWGSGKVGARALSTSGVINCQTAITASWRVTDAKVYSGAENTGQSVQTITSVLVCKKDYKNFTQTGSALACSDTSIALNSVTVTKVKDCQSTVVYNSTSGTDSFGCYYCDKGKAPSGTWSATTWVGSPGACTNYTGIANCDYPNKTASNTYNCV